MLTKEQITTYNNVVRSSADDLRAKGLSVAVHNDYFQDGKRYTFWLMTFQKYDMTVALKGEGETDGEALDKIRARYAELTDHLHHAPMCPANHYHGQRAPSGPCSCGAAMWASENEATGGLSLDRKER